MNKPKRMSSARGTKEVQTAPFPTRVCRIDCEFAFAIGDDHRESGTLCSGIRGFNGDVLLQLATIGRRRGREQQGV